MTKEEVLIQLQTWVDEGKLTSINLLGSDYRHIDKLLADKELFSTNIAGVYFTPKATSEEQEKFENLCLTYRVMPKNIVSYKLELTSLYAREKAVEKGELLRLDLGLRQILYIK